MRKILFREPIHLNISNKGKLRRVQHHKLQLPETNHHLLLTPASILTHRPQTKKQKYHFYLKKQEALKDKLAKQEFAGTQSPQETGSFRAIHTALPYDSIHGFPLRSITPIKPFRRGIRSTSTSNNSKTIEISQLREQKLVNRIDRQKPTLTSIRNHLRQAITYQSPENVFKYSQQEGYEEFYKYEPKIEVSTRKEEEISGRVAGTKIEPFKKYKIREVNKGWMSERKWEMENSKMGEFTA